MVITLIKLHLFVLVTFTHFKVTGVWKRLTVFPPPPPNFECKLNEYLLLLAEQWLIASPLPHFLHLPCIDSLNMCVWAENVCRQCVISGFLLLFFFNCSQHNNYIHVLLFYFCHLKTSKWLLLVFGFLLFYWAGLYSLFWDKGFSLLLVTICQIWRNLSNDMSQ